MDRRSFLAGAATGAALGLAGGYGAAQLPRSATGTAELSSAPDQAQPPAPTPLKQVRELKLLTTWPRDFPGLGTGAQRIADQITALTGGALTVRLYAAGEMVPAEEAFDAVASGAADMYHAAEYYWSDKSKAFNFFSTVPGGMLAPEINAWIQHGGGQALWDELAGGFGVKPLLCGNIGMQMGGWFNREIREPKDFQGLHFQVAGLGTDILRRLGAEPQTLRAAQIFPALQSSAIDGTEWLGPWNDLAFGFHKAAKFYYWPGFNRPGAAIALGINSAVWGSLSNTQRQIITAVATAENDSLYAEYMARNSEALQSLIHDQGVQLRKFPDAVMQAIGHAVAEVMTEIADSDPLTRKIYDSYVAFRRTVSEWTTLAERGYAEARSRYFS